MVKTRATLQEMGDELGCTREWVRQVIGWMRQGHGDQIFASEEAIWTPQEAASELEVSPNIVSVLCRSGEIPTRRRGVNEDGAYLIYEEGMRLLRVHLMVKKKRVCVVCGHTFDAGNIRMITCSEKCSKKRHYQQREKYTDQDPTIDSLRGWKKELWQRLQSHQIPKNEKWLTLSGAVQLTGLSRMQLAWLRLRNIVTIHHDPGRIATRTGKPMALYAASEMKIARQIFKAYTISAS